MEFFTIIYDSKNSGDNQGAHWVQRLVNFNFDSHLGWLLLSAQRKLFYEIRTIQNWRKIGFLLVLGPWSNCCTNSHYSILLQKNLIRNPPLNHLCKLVMPFCWVHIINSLIILIVMRSICHLKNFHLKWMPPSWIELISIGRF